MEHTTDTGNLQRILHDVGLVAWEFSWTTGRFISLEGAVEALLGYDRDRWLAPGFWQSRLHPEDFGWVERHCRESSAQGREHALEYRMIHADGSVVWIRDVAFSREDDRGVARGVFMRVGGPSDAGGMLSAAGAGSSGEMYAYELNLDGTVRWVSDAASAATGMSMSQLGGTSASALFDPDPMPLLDSAIKSVRGEFRLAGGPFILRAQKADGSTALLAFEVEIVRGMQGQPVSVLLLGHEPTSGEIAGRNARDLESATRLLGGLYLRIRADGLCVDAKNIDAVPIKGPPGGFIGHSVKDFHSIAVRHTISHAIEEALAREESVTREFVVGDDEAKTYLEARFVRHDTDTCAVVIRDVTERHRREQVLRLSERRFKTVFNESRVGKQLWRLAGDGDLILVATNPASDEILGVCHDAILGASISQCFAQFADSGLELVLKGLVEDGGYYSNPRLEYRRNAQRRVLDVEAFRSSPSELCVQYIDVTDQTEAQEMEAAYRERLRSLATQLSVTEELERRRLAEELHDRVLQPLSVGRMYLRQAQEDLVGHGSSEELEKALSLFEEATSESRMITTELFPPVLSELGLAVAISWLCEEAHNRYGLEVRCRVTVQAPFNPDESVAFLMFRAARELLVNASKHAQGADVDVALDLEGADVVLAVESRGETQEVEIAEGFGLFSLRERAQHMGGSLEVDACKHGGLKVVVRVPFAG